MSAWDTYEQRIGAHGMTRRGASKVNELRAIDRKVPNNLSYTEVEIYPMEYAYNIERDEAQENKIIQNVSIISYLFLIKKRMQFSTR